MDNNLKSMKISEIVRKFSFAGKSLAAHVIDNIQSEQDAQRAKEDYVDFLYEHYPQLAMLDRSEISTITSKDLHYVLNPEMKMSLLEFESLNRTMIGYFNLINKLL